MAGKTLTSSLVVRLIDQVSGPARKASGALLGLNKAAARGAGFGDRLAAAQVRNNRALDAARGSLFDAAATFVAFKAAVSAPLRKAADFEAVMLDIGQKANMSEGEVTALGKSVRSLSRELGKSATDLAGGIDNLMGKGLDAQSAQEAIKPITKTATAYRAALDDVSSASFAVMDNMKVPASNLGKALDIMAQAGKEGAFELKDMASEFPALTARAQALGMSGTKGVAQLSAALQIARKGAGTSAEAATNTANLMQKIISPETTKKFKKAGIDIRKELKKVQREGGDVFEFIADATDRATGGDMSLIGDFFQDAQVQSFLLPLMQNIEEYRRIRDKAAKADKVVDKDFARRKKTLADIGDRLDATFERLAISTGTALVPSIERLSEALIPVIDRVGQFVEAHPDLTANVAKAAAALVGFKVATASLRFLGLLGRGGALSMLSLGFRTIGRALVGAWRGAAGMIALQRALAAMSGTKYSALAKLGDAIKGMFLAIPGVGKIAEVFGSFGSKAGKVFGTAFAIAARVAIVAATVEALKTFDPKGNLGGLTSGIDNWLRNTLGLKASDTGITPGEIWQGLTGGGGEKQQPSGARKDLAAITESWPLAAQKAITSYGNALVAGGETAEAEAASIGDRVKSALSVEGNPTVNTADLERALSLARQVAAEVRGGTSSAGGQPGVSGHRARGGPVWPGSAFLVGENGPELFTPSSSGQISPNGGGVGSVTFGDIHIHGSSDPEKTADLAVRRIKSDLNQLLRGAHADGSARW